MRVLLYFSYDGSLFHGFQRQNDKKNVQSVLENALNNILGSVITIKGAGRTDALVHAKCQTAHFDTEYLPSNFKNDLNKLLNGEINVFKVKKVSNDFHARFSVKEKRYRYIINLDRSDSNNKYSFTVYYKLNIDAMKRASKLFLGTHDFQNFVSGERDDYHTYIRKIKIKKHNNKIMIDFYGTSFYRYMVRHLAGSLYDVGRGKITLDVIKNMLDYPNVHKQLTVLPAYGLYLIKVVY